MDIKKDKRRIFYNLVIVFVIISFAGWLIETANFAIRWKNITDRGFLTLPLCGIYGLSLIGMYLLLGIPTKGKLKGIYKKDSASKIKKILTFFLVLFLYFIAAVLVSTLFELITAFTFDKLFNIRLWNYTSYDCDFLGYICIGKSLLWGLMITLAMQLVFPYVYLAADKLSLKTAKILTIIFIVAISVDFVFNLTYLIAMGSRLKLY